MGYNAYVTCNCYTHGLAIEPPYKELVAVDEEGVYLQFPAGLWEKDQSLFLHMEAGFDAWKAHACAHSNMEVASERLANMSGMAAFKTIVQERGGTARFPVLVEYLPRANGGTLPAQYAPTLLQELTLLAAEPGELLATLRVQASGELLFSVDANTDVFFLFTGANQLRYGLNEEGFFIAKKHRPFFDREKLRVVFHSRGFRQQYLPQDRYRFTDLATGATYEAPTGLTAPQGSMEFKVELETVPLASEYAYILAPLKRLAVAAIQTGNPICWT
jgi:hypothetical protein